MAKMLIFKSILLGLSWGLLQGMIMFPGGVRLHSASGWYHTLSVITLVIFASICSEIGQKLNIKTFILVCGCVCLIWEFSEIGYRLARYDISGWYEHVCFFDVISIYLTDFKVALLHIARSIISVFLIWRFKR